MKKCLTLLLFALLILSSETAVAQEDVQTIKNKITDVKLDTKYLKEEVQNEDEYNAKEFAFQELLANVNMGRKEKGQDSLLEKHLRPHVQLLSYKRSSSYKGFAYVLIADVDKLRSGIPFVNYFNAARVTSSQIDSHREPGEKPSNPVEIPKTELAVTNPQPTPTPVEPTVVPIATTPTSSSSPSMVKNQVLMSITTMEVASEIKDALGEFLKEKTISAHGKKTKDVTFGEYDYILLFDQQETLQVILEPIGGGKYKNFQTKKIETLDEYRGKNLAAYWFRF